MTLRRRRIYIYYIPIFEKQGSFYLKNLQDSKNQEHFNFFAGFAVCRIGLEESKKCVGFRTCGIAAPKLKTLDDIVKDTLLLYHEHEHRDEDKQVVPISSLLCSVYNCSTFWHHVDNDKQATSSPSSPTLSLYPIHLE